MSLTSSIAYGIQNIGNESLYPMIEWMCELNWNPIDTQEHLFLINEVEKIFKYLYSNQNNQGNNQGKHDPHAIVHEKLYNALTFALGDPKGIDLFEDLLLRSIDKSEMTDFSQRLKVLLSQQPEGLKKTLELYTEMFHILRENQSTLIPPKKDNPLGLQESEAIERCQTYAYEDDLCNANQFRQFIADRKYREMLDREFGKGSGQKQELAQVILRKTKQSFIERTIESINQYIIEDDISIANAPSYQELIRTIYRLVDNFDNPTVIIDILDQLAKMPIIKRNHNLRAYLGERFFIKDSINQDPADLLKSYDDNRSLSFFKPNIALQLEEKVNLELLADIKANISRRIYKQDGLVETYLPVSMKGIKTSTRMLNEILYTYGVDGKLNVPEGPLNELYHLAGGKELLHMIMTSIMQDSSAENNTLSKRLDLNDYIEIDSNNNIIGFKNAFIKNFVEKDFNLHQLLCYAKMIKLNGINNYVCDLFDISKTPSLQRRIEKLCCDYYNGGGGEKLYAKISSLAHESIDLELILERSEDKSTAYTLKPNFGEIFHTPESRVKLFINLLLGDNPQQYHNIEQSIYQSQSIKTQQALKYQSLRNEFVMQKEKNLFRNGVETRQHVPADDEYFNLQVGDTQGSNVSITQVGAIATAYATRTLNEEPVYSWITIHEPQKAINCSHYMEKHKERLPAQEFSTGVLKSKAFIGAIRVRKLKPNEKGYNPDPNRISYKIVDGFVCEKLLKQFSDVSSENLYKTAKLYGLEGDAAHYLSRAILFSKAQEEQGEAAKLLKTLDESGYLSYETSAKAVQEERIRTQYQEQFDDPHARRDTIQKQTKFNAKIKTPKSGIPNHELEFFDPDSLRHYHSRQKKDILYTSLEGREVRLAKKRLRNEKQLRKSEKKLAEEMHGHTDFRQLKLNESARIHAIKHYSKAGLEEVPTVARAFPKTTMFQQYLSYIDKLFIFDDVITGDVLNDTKEKIIHAVNALFEIDADEANKQLSYLINTYYQLKRLPVIQGTLINAILSAIINKNNNFVSDANFSPDVQLAIKNIGKDETGLANYFNKTIDDAFLKNLEWSFEFIDLSNILTVMNSNNLQVHQTPWRLYQNKKDWGNDRQLDNWKKAASTQYEISSDGLNQLFEDLTADEDHPKKITKPGLLAKMRDYPITAGGGLNRNGLPIPSHIITDKSVCTQYFRLTQEQLSQLKSNEFITVLDSNECNDNAVYGANHVVQYRYPDLRDCQRLSQKYNINSKLVQSVKDILNQEVPEEIVKELWPNAKTPITIGELNNEQYVELTAGHREYNELIQTYNTNLQDVNAYPKPGEREEIEAIKASYETKYKILDQTFQDDTDFSNLMLQIDTANQLMLNDLVQNICSNKTLSAIERYQKLISIHFFPDMNGRTMRMFYQQETKKPLFMSCWDLDILMPTGNNKATDVVSIDDYSDYEFNKFVNIIGALHKEYFRAKKEGTIPNYYSNPEFYMASFELNPKYYSTNELLEFSTLLRSFYMKEDVQQFVDKKAYYNYMHLVMEHIYSWNKFKISSHIDLYQNSPLHLACMNKYSPNCLNNLLTQADAQYIDLLSLKNKYNQNPAHVAACYLNFEALSMLLEHSPALFNQLDNYGKTPYNNFMEKIKQKIINGSLSDDELIDFLTFAESLDKSKYDVLKYRFENNKTLADLLHETENQSALKILEVKYHNLEVTKADSSQDNQLSTPKPELRAPPLLRRFIKPDSVPTVSKQKLLVADEFWEPQLDILRTMDPTVPHEAPTGVSMTAWRYPVYKEYFEKINDLQLAEIKFFQDALESASPPPISAELATKLRTLNNLVDKISDLEERHNILNQVKAVTKTSPVFKDLTSLITSKTPR